MSFERYTLRKYDIEQTVAFEHSEVTDGNNILGFQTQLTVTTFLALNITSFRPYWTMDAQTIGFFGTQATDMNLELAH